MTLAATVEADLKADVAAVEAAAKKFGAAIVNFAKTEEKIAVTFVEAAFGKVEPLITGIPSAQAVILRGLIQTAAAELAAGDYTGIAQKVISQAITAETAFIANLGIEFVAAWAAIWAYNPASVGATTAL